MNPVTRVTLATTLAFIGCGGNDRHSDVPTNATVSTGGANMGQVPPQQTAPVVPPPDSDTTYPEDEVEQTSISRGKWSFPGEVKPDANSSLLARSTLGADQLPPGGLGTGGNTTGGAKMASARASMMNTNGGRSSR